ncbi:hypothetical protein [Listeria fleischmannii]|uniref:Acid-resistance membrane protein n=1 Tax=Listeria fleischmannii TaxID=1069827 RepID=A0A841YE31_9LIST|nr:hypothetical protein [Listeria fleischmannii]EIA20105.1 hypothetical protein KKC_08857 [Listeria fleischmannii subsp. coloradonensis]MBC1398521.1 hypothetical protein [Listeria fleischmannii]MBC1426582.1 hypothetical protein [Listeria fleischmannii]STY46503.1 Uncharacterised protein [Listeria fleischmannii subsp. coloradonensis]
MKKLTAQQKTLVIIGIILMIAVTIFGIIWNNQLATVIILGVVQFVLIQAVCYVGIYSQMKVGTSRGTKLFSWGILTTILFAVIIAIFAPDNFRSYSGAIIALLGYGSALIMREVENTNPANKKQKREE